jgi:hypothetical protein
MKLPKARPKLCSPVHRCFPPQPTICFSCKNTDPQKCPFKGLK